MNHTTKQFIILQVVLTEKNILSENIYKGWHYNIL